MWGASNSSTTVLLHELYEAFRVVDSIKPWPMRTAIVKLGREKPEWGCWMIQRYNYSADGPPLGFSNMTLLIA